MSQTVQLLKEEYEDMMDYIERMRETIDVLSNESTVRKLKDALSRMDAGEYLKKEEMVF